MSSGIILIMAQIDDSPGELLGTTISRLETMGAKNVQLLSSLTKKGRPGYVMLIDIAAEKENDVASLLLGELGIWGYRVLNADHKHFDIRKFEMKLKIQTRNGERIFPLRAKKIFNGGKFLRVKVEHDDMAGICAALAAEEINLPQAVLKYKVETGLHDENNILELEIKVL